MNRFEKVLEVLAVGAVIYGLTFSVLAWAFFKGWLL